jgi:hypothetical protein
MYKRIVKIIKAGSTSTITESQVIELAGNGISKESSVFIIKLEISLRKRSEGQIPVKIENFLYQDEV